MTRRDALRKLDARALEERHHTHNFHDSRPASSVLSTQYSVFSIQYSAHPHPNHNGPPPPHPQQPPLHASTPNLQQHAQPHRQIHQAAAAARARQRAALPLQRVQHLQAVELRAVRPGEDPVREHRVGEERDQDAALLAAERAQETPMERGAAEDDPCQDHGEGAEDRG
ncbi:hypothetical protein B7494_g948 [Chlorociboria aeruginascens]|nr:hypothetical protein B7494_g948 [Chlorociboria aeruginascens]